MAPDIILYSIIFLFGIVIGSFLNVCIFRIPKKEDIVKTSSHCMSCGYHLKWYDMIPVFSFLALRGLSVTHSPPPMQKSGFLGSLFCLRGEGLCFVTYD